MSERSPTPWTYEIAGEQHYGEVDDFPFVIKDADGWNIAASIGDVPDLPAEANAAFIVHAVNLHDEMVEALREAEACMSIVEPKGYKDEYLRILGVVRSALSKSIPTQEGE